MSSRKLIPVVVPLAALVLLVAALVNVGAQPKPGIRIPPGEVVDSPSARSMNETARRPVPEAPALPVAGQGATLMAFDGSSLDDWQSLTDTNIEWVAEGGRLQQRLPMSDIPAYEPALFVTRDASLTDGVVEAMVYPTSGSPVGIVLRGGSEGHYRVVLHATAPNDKSKAWIERVTGSVSERIAEAPFTTFAGYNLETWQHVKVTARGSEISVAVDGRTIVSATDNKYAAGWVGVWTLADQGASFDNVRIQRGAAR
ncbi:MAG TPA: family 16 glycoside hydrolase [Chloroflexia bacterium]|nr:family 16 glycoside hydrolase [Chloroflexia bacterium]